MRRSDRSCHAGRRLGAWELALGVVVTIVVVGCGAPRPAERETSAVEGGASPAIVTPGILPTLPTSTLSALPTNTLPAHPTGTLPTLPTSTVPAHPTGTLSAVPTSTVSALPIGAQVFEADVDTMTLEYLRRAGLGWVRMRALWDQIEPIDQTPPHYDWAVTDRAFGAAAAAGMQLVVVVYGNPKWVSPSGCGPVPAADRGRYAAFWQALVERYDGDGRADAPVRAPTQVDRSVTAPNRTSVRYWQVSNEVDFDPTVKSGESDYGGCFGNDPPAYAEQLVVAYRAAKAADAGAQVGFGPLAYDRFTAASAPAGWTAQPGPFVYDFTHRAIQHLYQRHAGDKLLPFFDFVAVHNYNDNAHFWDGPERPLEHELVGKLRHFRAEQLVLPGVFDLRAAPILVSETGLASGPSDTWTARSEDRQAVYAAQTMVRGLAAGTVATIWYTARDNLIGDCAPPHWDWLTYGLLRSRDVRTALGKRCPKEDWLDQRAYALDSPATPKPALTALATLVRSLSGTRFEEQLAPPVTGSEAIEAYVFRAREDGQDRVVRTVIAAWTTNGERLGKRGAEEVRATLVVGRRGQASGIGGGTDALPGVGVAMDPWTGVVAIADYRGQSRKMGAPGSAEVAIPLGQGPVFIEAIGWE